MDVSRKPNVLLGGSGGGIWAIEKVRETGGREGRQKYTGEENFCCLARGRGGGGPLEQDGGRFFRTEGLAGA